MALPQQIHQIETGRSRTTTNEHGEPSFRNRNDVPVESEAAALQGRCFVHAARPAVK
jgi:hypothetical protein